jgi:hypothetical protein
MFRQLEGESPYPSSSLVVNPGVRVAGGRTYLGRSPAGHGIVTEREGIGSATSQKSALGVMLHKIRRKAGTVPRKGNKIKGRVSKRRDSGADSGRKTSPNQRYGPFRWNVGVMLRSPPRKGSKRWWRSTRREAWLEANDSRGDPSPYADSPLVSPTLPSSAPALRRWLRGGTSPLLPAESD